MCAVHVVVLVAGDGEIQIPATRLCTPGLAMYAPYSTYGKLAAGDERMPAYSVDRFKRETGSGVFAWDSLSGRWLYF